MSGYLWKAQSVQCSLKLLMLITADLSTYLSLHLMPLQAVIKIMSFQVSPYTVFIYIAEAV